MRARVVLMGLWSACLAASLLEAEEMRLTALPAAMPREPFTATPLDPLHELAQQHPTPQAVAEYLRREFTFRRDVELFDQIEYWQTPAEFLSRRMGDCEDYALLAQTLLAQNGIEAYVFSLFGEGDYAHTVCVFVDDRGRYNVINQDKIRYYRAKTLQDLASAMYPAWTFGGITEQAGIRGRLVKEITHADTASSAALPTTASSVADNAD